MSVEWQEKLSKARQLIDEAMADLERQVGVCNLCRSHVLEYLDILNILGNISLSLKDDRELLQLCRRVLSRLEDLRIIYLLSFTIKVVRWFRGGLRRGNKKAKGG